MAAFISLTPNQVVSQWWDMELCEHMHHQVQLKAYLWQESQSQLIVITIYIRVNARYGLHKTAAFTNAQSPVTATSYIHVFIIQRLHMLQIRWQS